MSSKLRRTILNAGIRLIGGGRNQKTTQGMLQGAGSTSRGGVETMRSMGTMPKMPPKPVNPAGAPLPPRHPSLFPANSQVGQAYSKSQGIKAAAPTPPKPKPRKK